jgi:hypothetical protein
MTTITLRHIPTEKEVDWLVKNIGERRAWLPNYISGKGWKIRKTNITVDGRLTSETNWTLEFDDAKLASYYILKFK